MSRRWGQDRPHDQASNHQPEWLVLLSDVAIVVAFLITVVVGGIILFGKPAGANDLDCQPAITGPYADYDGSAAVTLDVPDYCAAPQAVRLVVFSLPPGVTALTPQSLDVDQTPTVIIDATLQPGVPNTVDPGVLHGCGDLQIDAAPATPDWASLQVGVVAPHNLPGAYTASAEHADDQCQPCQFAVPVPDSPLSVEEHDDAPCGALTPQTGAPGEQTGPDSKGVPVLSAATPDVTPATPSAGVASSEAETTAPPLTVVSASAAPTNVAVEAAYAELPNTGISLNLWLRAVIGLFATGALIVIVTWATGRKVGRR